MKQKFSFSHSGLQCSRAAAFISAVILAATLLSAGSAWAQSPYSYCGRDSSCRQTEAAYQGNLNQIRNRTTIKSYNEIHSGMARIFENNNTVPLSSSAMAQRAHDAYLRENEEFMRRNGMLGGTTVARTYVPDHDADRRTLPPHLYWALPNRPELADYAASLRGPQGVPVKSAQDRAHLTYHALARNGTDLTIHAGKPLASTPEQFANSTWVSVHAEQSKAKLYFRIAESVTVIQTPLARIGDADANVRDAIYMASNALVSSRRTEGYTLDACEVDPALVCLFFQFPNRQSMEIENMGQQFGKWSVEQMQKIGLEALKAVNVVN
jgi:hypothetical protein